MNSTQQPPNLVTCRPTLSVAAVVLVHDDKILLQRHPRDAEMYASMWDLPQIVVPAGESPEDALLKVAGEQFGIEIQGLHLVAAHDDLVTLGEDATETCCRRFVYRVTEFTGEMQAGELRRWYKRKEFVDVFQLNPIVKAIQVFEDA